MQSRCCNVSQGGVSTSIGPTYSKKSKQHMTEVTFVSCTKESKPSVHSTSKVLWSRVVSSPQLCLAFTHCCSAANSLWGYLGDVFLFWRTDGSFFNPARLKAKTEEHHTAMCDLLLLVMQPSCPRASRSFRIWRRPWTHHTKVSAYNHS